MTQNPTIIDGLDLSSSQFLQELVRDRPTPDAASPSTKDAEAPTPSLILKEIEAITVEIQQAIARGKARLMELMHQEAQRIFEEAVSQGLGHLVGKTLSSLPGDGSKNDGGTAQNQPSSGLMDPLFLNLTQDPGSTAPAPPSEADSNSKEQLSQESSVSDSYEGTVRLIIQEGDNGHVVRFVDELCQRPQFRLLRVEGNGHNSPPDVWLVLRENLQLEEMLLQLDSVNSVMAAPGMGEEPGEVALRVWLSEPSS